MKVKVTIPEGYHDIKLKDFQKLRALEGDDEFITIKTIEILTGIRGDEALRMRAKDRNAIIKDLSEALKEENTKLIRKFNLDGKDFGFIPNLDDMTFGEFTNLETYSMEDPKDWHKLLAIFYRPIIKEYGNLYEIEPYEGSAKYSEIMKEAPTSVILSAIVFFYTIAKDMLSSSQKYIVEEAAQMIKKGDSHKNGDGIVQLLDLQQNILKTLRKHQSVILNNALPELHTTLINMN